MSRSELNKKIWILLRKRYIPGPLSEEEAIRVMREEWCADLTKRTRPEGMHTSDYNDLSDSELSQLLHCVQFNSLPLHKYPLPAMASREQVAKLRFLAMECALAQFTFNGISIVEDGKTIEGAELKYIAQLRWKAKALRGAIYNTIHTKWIHPLMHRWLQEGGLRYAKRYPANTEYFHWADLNNDEASYLIQRFSKMYNTGISRGTAELPANTDHSLN